MFVNVMYTHSLKKQTVLNGSPMPQYTPLQPLLLCFLLINFMFLILCNIIVLYTVLILDNIIPRTTSEYHLSHISKIVSHSVS